MNRFWIIICIPFALQCKNPSGYNKPTKPEAGEQTTHLPVRDILLDDLQKVDSNYTGILLKISQDKRRDSSFISLERFKEWAVRLLPRALDSAIFNSSFSEISFKDESTGQYQFIYEDTLPQTDLKKTIVYIQPGAGNDHVKRIYMESEERTSDSITERKIIWNLEHYIISVENIKRKDKEEIIRISRAIWDPAFYSED